MASPAKEMMEATNIDWRKMLAESTRIKGASDSAIRYSMPVPPIIVPRLWGADMAKVLNLPTGYEGNSSYGSW